MNTERPAVEDFIKLVSNPNSPWGMADVDALELCNYILKLETDNRRLEKLVYMPGQWRCPKCEFQLTQSNMNAADGTVTARDDPGDKCPNCDSPLWRVSYREAFKDTMKIAERIIEEKNVMHSRFAATEILRAALKEIADLDKHGGYNTACHRARAALENAK